MKRQKSPPHANLCTAAQVKRLAPLRPRDATMDAVVKHVHASEQFSFEAACAAIGAALSKVEPAR